LSRKVKNLGYESDLTGAITIITTKKMEKLHRAKSRLDEERDPPGKRICEVNGSRIYPQLIFVRRAKMI
jgi:hypothetical protein